MKTHFDVAVVVPLEEEFDVVLAQFQYVNNLSTPRRVRFEVAVAGSSARILLVKQNAMGRSAACVSRPRSDEAGAIGDRAAQARGCQTEGRTRHSKKLSRAVARLRAVETAHATLAPRRVAAVSLLEAQSPSKNVVHGCMRT
jgi:hypothetical protein